jgi:hypothetical protein
MGGSGVPVDRFWVNRFVEQKAGTLTLGQATCLEEDRHTVVADDLKRYFDCAANHLQTIPSQFVWNPDETRVGAPKKQKAPRVIVSIQTGPEPITVPEIRDDSQLTLLTAISAFGDSIPPLFITKNKTFEKKSISATAVIRRPRLYDSNCSKDFYDRGPVHRLGANGLHPVE